MRKIDRQRRHFLGTAALTVAAARLGVIEVAQAQSNAPKSTRLPATKSGTNISFGPLKQIGAGALNVGYAGAGPADGPPVILLHGWPYDIHSFVDVAPLLASAGYRVIVPHLRGYDFLSSDTPRNGQQSVVAVDAIALMDALKIQKAIIGGFDWGARTANIMAACPSFCRSPAYTAPERVFEPLQGLARNRINHLLMEARIGFDRRQSARDQQFRVVEVDRLIEGLVAAVVIDDREPFAGRAGRQLFVAHRHGHVVSDEAAGARIEGIDLQRSFGRIGNFA
jgi:pimeloyl-ACP methyl ester carboxylesterase